MEDAKADLSPSFVGVQERFDESLLLLQERLGMPVTAYGASVHVNADRPSFEEVGEENLALIEKYNRLDAELFAWGARALRRRLRRHRSDELGGAVETFRGAITEKAAEQEKRTALALQWLTEQLPPGTERPFKALLADAEKIGITTRDLRRPGAR